MDDTLAPECPYNDLGLMPSINFKVIPHDEQRYETVGDYWFEDAILQVRVSKMDSAHKEFLVFIHEMVEVYLILSKGIAIEDIDKFDKRFEEFRTAYPDLVGDDEPGDHPKAPYYKEHAVATRIEKWLAQTLNEDWDLYEDKCNSLYRHTF